MMEGQSSVGASCKHLVVMELAMDYPDLEFFLLFKFYFIYKCFALLSSLEIGLMIITNLAKTQ